MLSATLWGEELSGWDGRWRRSLSDGENPKQRGAPNLAARSAYKRKDKDMRYTLEVNYSESEEGHSDVFEHLEEAVKAARFEIELRDDRRHKQVVLTRRSEGFAPMVLLAQTVPAAFVVADASMEG